MLIAGVALLAVVVSMLLELRISRRNERDLRAAGAIEPPDEVYDTMRWAYPAAFVLMALEGAIWGPAPGATTIAGAVVLVGSKALKVWAIWSLGRRWTYRVLVPPHQPLVSTGPYGYIRHPNYVAVIGELVGMALFVGALVSGAGAVVGFGWLLTRRIRVEERALGLR